MPPYPETQSPIRLLVPQERDPGLVAANRRFMQSRSQARRLIDKTAQDERDAQAGVTPEMRALKEAQARENQITSIMENTGGTREEAAEEVDAQLERDLLRPGVESAIEREAARRGRRGLGRAGWREAFGRRKAREKQALDALDRGDSEAVSQILGVRAEYDTAPDVFQKAWTVGGIRMSPGKVKQRVLAKVRQAVTQEMRGQFAPTMEERGRAGLRREAEEAMLPGVPVAPTKPKPIAWKPTGVSGLFFDPENPEVTIDFREPRTDLVNLGGGRVVAVEFDKGGNLVGKPRDYIVPPSKETWTLKTFQVPDAEGAVEAKTYLMPTRPGQGEPVPVLSIPVPPDMIGAQTIYAWEGKERVILKVQNGQVASVFYPERKGRVLASVEKEKWDRPDKPGSWSLRWTSEDPLAPPSPEAARVAADGKSIERIRLPATEEAPAETEAVEPTQPEPEESDLSQDQVNGVYDALRQERPDLDPKSEEFGAVLEKRLRALGT